MSSTRPNSSPAATKQLESPHPPPEQEELRTSCRSPAATRHPESPPHATPSDPQQEAFCASWRSPATFSTESQRLALLQSFSVLQTKPEPRFDCITRLMTSIFQAPVALVSLSGSEQLWFKSVAGPFGSCLDRRGSFCDIVLVPDEPEVCVLEDLSNDSRFAQHPNVAGAPFLRFYAGAPLVGSSGHRYGTLCVLDVRPRSFPASLINTLVNFAELVTRELELGAVTKNDALLPKEMVHLVRSSLAYEDPVALIDISNRKENWYVLYCNAAWGREAAVPSYTACCCIDYSTCYNTSSSGSSSSSSNASSARSSASTGTEDSPAPKAASTANTNTNTKVGFWDLFEVTTDHPDDVKQMIEVATKGVRPFKLRVRRKGPLGALVGEMVVVFRPASDVLTTKVPVGIPGFMPFSGSAVGGGELGGSGGGGGGSGGGGDEARYGGAQGLAEEASVMFNGKSKANLWFASLRSNTTTTSTTKTAMTNTPSRSRGNSLDEKRQRQQQPKQQLRRQSDDSADGVIDHNDRQISVSTIDTTDDKTPTYSLSSAVDTPPHSTPSTPPPPSTTTKEQQQPTSCPSINLPPPSPHELLPYGMILPARYHDMLLGPLLGIGAYGRVHRGVWKNHLVAVKLIEIPVGSPHWNSIERAVAEGAISIDLHHPNIVPTVDFCHSRRAIQPDLSSFVFGSDWAVHSSPTDEMNCVWIVQEFCNHGKLADALDRGWLRTAPSLQAPIHLHTYLSTASDIANGLVFLHAKGIVHGDLTYNNVLLSSKTSVSTSTSPHSSSSMRGGIGMHASCPWVAKIGDFGLARLVVEDVLNATRHYGTLSHCAPEALMEGAISPKIDIYSLGVLLWEMWTGVRAWCGQMPGQIVVAVTQGNGLKGMPGDAPEALQSLVARCLSMDPAQRPHAAQVWVELQAMMLTL